MASGDQEDGRSVLLPFSLRAPDGSGRPVSHGGHRHQGTYLGRAPDTETRPTTRGRTTRMLGWWVRWDDGSEQIVRGVERMDPPIKPLGDGPPESVAQ